MLAMSTLMMPAPTMALGAPQLAVGPHQKPPEAKLLAIHPAHTQTQTTPQHQLQAQQQQQQQQAQQQQQVAAQQQQVAAQQHQQQLQQLSAIKQGRLCFSCSCVCDDRFYMGQISRKGSIRAPSMAWILAAPLGPFKDARKFRLVFAGSSNFNQALCPRSTRCSHWRMEIQCMKFKSVQVHTRDTPRARRHCRNGVCVCFLARLNDSVNKLTFYLWSPCPVGAAGLPRSGCGIRIAVFTTDKPMYSVCSRVAPSGHRRGVAVVLLFPFECGQSPVGWLFAGGSVRHVIIIIIIGYAVTPLPPPPSFSEPFLRSLFRFTLSCGSCVSTGQWGHTVKDRNKALPS